MLRRRIIALTLGPLALLSGVALGQTSVVAPNVQTVPIQNAQIDQSVDIKGQSTGTIPTEPQPVPVAPAQPADTMISTPPVPVPLTPAEQKAADNKAALDALLSEASALKASFENNRRSRNKTPMSLSVFRSMELRLQMAAAADPTNTQVSDMANAMQMVRYQILQPSVQIAAIANRELYVYEMGKQMRDDGMKVVASGRDNNTVRFSSPHMTRQMAMQLVETAKIPEQARALQFKRVVFSSGRRSWTYDVARGRLR